MSRVRLLSLLMAASAAVAGCGESAGAPQAMSPDGSTTTVPAPGSSGSSGSSEPAGSSVPSVSSSGSPASSAYVDSSGTVAPVDLGAAGTDVVLPELPAGDASLSEPAAVAVPEVVVPAEGDAEPADGLLLRYVVIPHPDDEFEAWAAISGDRRHYTVFLLMTRGEASQFCDGSGIEAAGDSQALAGERVPLPQSFLGPGDHCAAQRVDAWHSFLNDMAGTDPVLDLPLRLGTLQGVDPPEGAAPTYELWTGPRTARLVFDLGDGDLTSDEVIWAVDTARSLRGTRLPDLAEDDVIAAAYYNDSYPDAIVYDHPDHRAVQEAVFDHDFGTPGGQFGRTTATDPDRRYTFAVPPPVYCAAMCVQPGPIDPVANPEAFRVGYLQRNYGWLAEHYWVGALVARGSIFSQQQDFWVRF